MSKYFLLDQMKLLTSLTIELVKFDNSFVMWVAHLHSFLVSNYEHMKLRGSGENEVYISYVIVCNRMGKSAVTYIFIFILKMGGRSWSPVALNQKSGCIQP